MTTKNTYFYFLSFISIFFIGCTSIYKAPIYTKPVQSNKDYIVSYLFEHDGCKVYRFDDAGEYVYFTTCNGETSYRADSTTIIRNRTKKD